MTGYDFHPEAELDLDELWDFIAEDNPAAADRVAEDIFAALKRWYQPRAWATRAPT